MLQEALWKSQLSGLQKLMQSAGMSDDEVRRLMQQHEDDLYRQSAVLREQKESQRDAVLAKLAARKKLKEEQTREAAVTRELEQILHDQVRAQQTRNHF